MANYELVVNSKFQPFSYERYMQPILAYDQAYKALEEQYGAIEDKASVLEKLRDSDIDADSYKEYRDYISNLESARDSLYSRGMTGADRRKLMQARRDYMSTIQPLQDAFDRREKEALIQYQAEMSNPYIRFSRDARSTSLSQYKAGTPDIQVIDGTKLAQMASQMAQPYAQRIINELGPEGLKKILPFQYQQQVDYGLSPQQLLAGLAEAASGNPQSQAAKIISNIQQQVYNQSGLGSWNKQRREELTPWAYSMINSGLNSLIGKSTINDLKDEYSMHEAEADNAFQRSLLLEQQKAALKGGVAGAGVMGTDYIYNEVGQQEARDSYDKFKSYFQTDTNGNIYLNQAGRERYRKELNTNPRPRTSQGNVAPGYDPNQPTGYRDSEFVAFIKAIGADKYIDTTGTNKSGKLQYHSNRYGAGKAYKDYMASRGISTDGTNVKGTAIIPRDFDAASSENIIRRISREMSNTITPMHYDGSKYVEDKDSKDMLKREFRNNNIRLQDIYINEVSGDLVARVYRVNPKADETGGKAAVDDKTYNIVIPQNSSFYNSYKVGISKLRSKTKEYEQAKSRGASKDKLAQLENELSDYRDALYTELGALGVTTKSKTEDYDPNE